MSQHTFWFLVRWYLILRENHSLEVCPLLKTSLLVAFVTASATTVLSSVRAWRITESLGRVNIARDQRGRTAWAPGEGLDESNETLTIHEEK